MFETEKGVVDGPIVITKRFSVEATKFQLRRDRKERKAKGKKRGVDEHTLFVFRE